MLVSIIDPFPGTGRVLYFAVNDGTGNFTVSAFGTTKGTSGDSGFYSTVQDVIGVPVFP